MRMLPKMRKFHNSYSWLLSSLNRHRFQRLVSLAAAHKESKMPDASFIFGSGGKAIYVILYDIVCCMFEDSPSKLEQKFENLEPPSLLSINFCHRMCRTKVWLWHSYHFCGFVWWNEHLPKHCREIEGLGRWNSWSVIPRIYLLSSWSYRAVRMRCACMIFGKSICRLFSLLHWNAH